MGWCSGTDVFDPVVMQVLSLDIPVDYKRAIIRSLINALEDHDWDCQDESMYFGNALVQPLFKELHPDWDWDEEEE